MRLYHVTPHADAILREGFRDGEGLYGYSSTRSGVYLSDEPIGVDQAEGDTLSVDVPDDVLLDEFEHVDMSAPAGWYREWLVPASLLNERAEVRLFARAEPIHRPPGITGV